MPLIVNVALVVGAVFTGFAALVWVADRMPDRLFLLIDRILGGRRDADGVCICGLCADCRHRYAEADR